MRAKSCILLLKMNAHLIRDIFKAGAQLHTWAQSLQAENLTFSFSLYKDETTQSPFYASSMQAHIENVNLT